MGHSLTNAILSNNEEIRSLSITSLLKGASLEELKQQALELEQFRLKTNNLYHKVRACLFLFVIYRLYLMEHPEIRLQGEIPFNGVKYAFDRKFDKAIEIYLDWIDHHGHDSSLCSALADVYYKLGFSYLLKQVKLSISKSPDNHKLFNIDMLNNYPYRVPADLSVLDAETGRYPVGLDTCPVRIDPSHSSWSDIFFLGMDFPEGARVINISVDLKIHGSNRPLLPPCECYSHVIDEPVIHLISVDLRTEKKINSLSELFNFGNDYLSLLKAGVVASGIIPPCFENREIKLRDLLEKLLGRPGGLKVITNVNNIPKGSRLAVSTTLLSTIITRLMRMSGQIKDQAGSITEKERRTVASRAILGEWLGGSGGGWQDSGGVWPGIKVITGKKSAKDDPEYGVSNGCLLPCHYLLSKEEIPDEIENKIVDSMVLIHGGISQNVGPILEMVTEKYLLKYSREWQARLEGNDLFDRILKTMLSGDMKQLGKLTSQDWNGPLQTIIPWVNNAFTEELIRKIKELFKEDYWGFLMLGGMSGGGMAFIVNPSIQENFKEQIALIMKELKKTYKYAYPFIIDPVVYDFNINHKGIIARILPKENILELEQLLSFSKPALDFPENKAAPSEDAIKKHFGFNSDSHQYMKKQLKKGEIGLAQNRIPVSTRINNVTETEIQHFEHEDEDPYFSRFGYEALKQGKTGVVTFAGGLGSRWTEGASVVKPIHPFVKIDGDYRTFIEIHLAKSRKTEELCDKQIPHVFTTSYLTHNAINDYLERFDFFGSRNKIYLSPGKSIGRRIYPMQRDLNFFWEEQPHQKLDDNAEKVQKDLQQALIDWSKTRGEGEDYTENSTMLRFNPPGHWYEIPNLIKNGTLSEMLQKNEGLEYLFCHNIDTMGAGLDPTLMGMHIASESCMSFEVTPRRIIDQGGGLAKINNRLQLIEGMALPREEDEYRLSYYNTLSHWISIDRLLDFFGLNRGIIIDSINRPELSNTILKSIHEVEKLIPTYVTIKNVKYVWGSGQEDVYPVAQFEKLWGDMTGLDNLPVSYVSVSRFRGQQLKDPSQSDIWLADGSYDYVSERTSF